MKLYTAKATPFGRTVEIVAHETGQHGDIEIVATSVTPTKANAEFQAVNPLRKIPALVTDEGGLIVDSTLISQYIARRAGNDTIFAHGDPDHWSVMNEYMIAKGITECVVAARYENFVRPEEHRWKPWTEDLLGKAHAALGHFDAAPPAYGETPTIAAIALGAVLGYLDFRFPDEAWRNRYTALAAWSEPLFARDSFQATRPD